MASSVSVLGLLLTAIFLLTVIQKVFSGPVNPRWKELPDLTVTEKVALFPAIALMFILGFYPQLITGMVHGTVMQWIAGGGL
jgi:NADH-quinone oxidoreductase subunit M